MWNAVLKLFEWLAALIWRVRPALRVEVRLFLCEDERDEPDHLIAVITAWPRRYCAHLTLTNWTDNVVYIKNISVTINGDTTYESVQGKEFLRLEPREPKQRDVVFPIEHDEAALEAGRFQIDVVPSVGRGTRVSGEFPLEHQE